jgi:hypothetical protein
MTPMPRWFVRALALLAMLALPVAAIFTGGARLVPFLAMPLFVLGGPMLLGLGGEGREPGADTGDDSDSDDGPGGNKRPDRRPPAPSGPTGLLPLEHSAPSSFRMRGNGRQRISDPGHRRAPHQPSRSPQRVPAGPRRHA